ncbi:MAG: MFS transporter [bacterium]|nr:MFS transporter [bacterium]
MLTTARKYVLQFDRNLWILSVGWFVSALGFAVSIPFIAIYFHSVLDLSMSQIGYFFGSMAVVRAVFQGLGGEISDRIERRQLMINSQLARVVAFSGLALSIAESWGFWPVAGFLFVASASGAVFQPAANAMVSDILPEEKRIDGYAITRAAGNLGWAAGPALGGFLAAESYSMLFLISAIVTVGSSTIFWLWLKSPETVRISDRFRMRDLLAIKDDKLLATHCTLIFILYLVVAQLMAPFSVYAVDMVRISETELGYLYTINGLMVALLQVPTMTLVSKWRLTSLLATGGFIYAIGYGMVGLFPSFSFFIIAMMIITMGEIFMSPPALALTSALAPKGRMGRYMGIFGLFVASGWSFGPLYGGMILEHLSHDLVMAWVAIASLALVSSVGYLLFRRRIPESLDRRQQEAT